MANNIPYPKEMLEVPFIDGQSEDICGNDDRYYAFGLWTDFCGMEDEELRKAGAANARGDNPCCEGEEEPTELEINKISLSISGGNKIVATAEKPVDVDVVLTVTYVVMKSDGTTSEEKIKIRIPENKKAGSVQIHLDDGQIVKISNDIEVNPSESELYEFIAVNDSDIKINSILYGTVHYNSMEETGIAALTPEIINEFGEVFMIGSDIEISKKQDAEVDENYRGQQSIAINHSYDFIFLIDRDIDKNDLIFKDETDIESDVLDLGDSIGTVEYDGEIYNAFRLSNPLGWSVVVADGEPMIGYEWKYKIVEK